MKLKVCIQDNEDSIKVLETEADYLEEGSKLTSKNRFEYLDTVAVDIFVLNTTEKRSVLSYSVIDRSTDKDVNIKLEKDGWFTLYHIVIPSKKWFEKELAKNLSTLNIYSTVYYSDGKYIYKYENSENTKIFAESLVDLNIENTTISLAKFEYVYVKNFRKTHLEKWIEVFKKRIFESGCKVDSCEARRLTGILNLIRHHVRWGQLAEAERIIEKVNLSYDTHFKTNNFKPCGC